MDSISGETTYGLPMDNAAPFVERPLTEKERSIVVWLLQHGNEEASKYLPEVEQATVVGRCPCGCKTIYFAISGHRPENDVMIVLSDYYWVDDDGHTNGIFVYSISGQLAGLEVHTCDGIYDKVQIPDPIRLIRMPPQQDVG